MKPGDVIEFDTGDEYLLGVITRDLGEKFIATSEEGDERRPSPEQVTFEFDRSFDDSARSERLADRLSRFRETLDEAAEEVDSEFLWEYVRDESDRISPAAAAEMFFDGAEPSEVHGVLESLRSDTVHFKQHGTDFEPRDPEQAEQLREQRRAEQRRRQRRQAFVEGVAKVLGADEGDRDDLLVEHREREGFDDRLATIRDYALEDRDSDAREEALDLLDDVEDEAGITIDGRYGDKAFQLLVELGLWGPHENLALRRSDLDVDPGNEAREKAEELAEQVGQLEGLDVVRETAQLGSDQREDFTDLQVFSIDAEGTTDIDDALSVRRPDDGRLEIGVHIADAAAWVESGGTIDEFARQRGSSLYLPTTDRPMLPEQLSEEVASLAGGQTRPAVSLLVQVDDELEIDDWSVVPSIVESDGQLTYEEVDAVLAGDDDDHPFADELSTLVEVARARRRSREKEGGVQIDLPDPDLDVTWEDGEPRIDCGIEDDSTPARELVGEFMILANYLLGLFCQRQRVPAIYRTQPDPDGELVDDRVLDYPEGRPRQFQTLYNMEPARVTLDPGNHYGLGVPVYAQATSPIRRYGDLVTQRQIKAAAADAEPPHGEDEMAEVIGDVRRATGEAGRIQSETQRYWLLEYMRRADRDTWTGVVLDHYDDDGSRGSVWIEEVAQKFSARFRKKIPLGEETELSIERINPRRDDIQLVGEPVT
ncbi:MAG: ribonuclease catalytic domain-containing protein [Bradymonadaceae bacterium]